MRRALILSILLFFVSTIPIKAQLVVAGGYSSNDLSQQIVGQGLSIIWDTLMCPGPASGIFDGTNSNIGFNDGIILTSGHITNAPGPNTVANASGINTAPGYPLLTALSGNPTLDRCVLEFDVVPLSDTMTFNYVFASEEYPEFAPSAFNDAFGFFVSGLDPLGGNYVDENIALLPTSNITVSINNVNATTNSTYYINNNGTGNYPIPNSTVQYDGFTVTLQAVIPTVPCKTYRMKLAVADAVDRIYDSGVFIESNSLNSLGYTITPLTNAFFTYPNLVEGCLDGFLQIRRVTRDAGQHTLHLTIAGTATNGVDYATIPDSIVLPANQNIFNIPLIAFADAIAEGSEFIKIYMSISCAGIVDSAIIRIDDHLMIPITPDTAICAGESIQLSAANAKTYSWSPGVGMADSTIANPVVSPQVTTTYTLSVSVDSCFHDTTVTITVYDNPIVDAGPDTSLCLGSFIFLNATVTNASSFQWSPPGGLSNTGITNPLANPLSTTPYVLTAQNGNNCIADDTVWVTVNNFPTVTAGPDVSICKGESTQLHGTGAVIYKWSPKATLDDRWSQDPNATPLTTTTYQLLGTDSNGCTSGDQVKVTVLDLPVINAGSDQIICDGDTAQLSASGGTSYLWTPFNLVSDSSLQNPLATPTVPTYFIVEGTDANGCSNKDTVFIDVKLAPTITATPITNTVCPGTLVQLNASGGITYQWRPSAGLNNDAINNPIATVTANVVYTVKAWDATGCWNTATVTLNIHPLPIINAGSEDTICFGDSKQLIASNGVTFTWSPPGSLNNPNIANPIATPLITTTYSLSVTDVHGCSNTTTVKMVVEPLPIASAGPDITVCEKSLLPLNASGGVKYKWEPSGLVNCDSCKNTYIIPLSNTVLTLTVYNAAGCEDQDIMNITVVPIPPTGVLPSDTGICPGGIVQLTAFGGNSYVWQNIPGLNNYSIANPIATPSVTTNYYVEIEDLASGCKTLDSALITVHPLPNVNAGMNDSLCMGTSLTLLASGALTYVWSPNTGLNNPNIANPITTTSVNINYMVTGTDVNGCVNTDDIAITVLPNPIADAGPDLQACQNIDLPLTGLGGTQYSWSPSAGLSCNNCQNPVFNYFQSMGYELTVSDAFGCSDVDSIYINVNAAPVIGITGDTAICPGTSIPLSATGGGTYDWQPSGLLNNPTIANPVANPSTGTVFMVNVTGSNGCSATDSVFVDVHPDIILNVSNDTFYCEGLSMQLNASGASSYNWSPSIGLSNTNIGNPVASPANSQVYMVTGTDAFGCTASETVSITVNPLPVVNLSQGDVTICVNTSIQLGASGGITYRWTPSQGLNDPRISNPIASPNNKINYFVRVEDINGCVSNASVLVDLFPVTDPDAQPSNVGVCPGIPVQLSSKNGISYQWSPPDFLNNPNIADPVSIPTQSIVYTLTIVDINNCTFTDEVDIHVHPAAQADAGIDASILIGNSVSLNGSGNGNFTWSPIIWLDDPSISNPIAGPEETTVYHLKATTPNGCEAMDSMTVFVFNETTVTMPNAFTPNGDGKHDTYGPEWYHDFDMTFFQIYNRWGELMFSSNDRNEKWDGTYNDAPQSIGSYVFIVRGWGNLGEPFILQGNFTLIR